MSKAKSIFISVWITLLSIGSIRALWQLTQVSVSIEWLLVLMSLLPSLLFFVWLFATPVARTAKGFFLPLGIALLPIIGLFSAGVQDPEMWFWVLGVGGVGGVLYEAWYSRFGRRDVSQLKVGMALPALQFERVDHSTLHTATLQKPMLMIFFRGNWCPLCMAQVKEIASQYRVLAEKGVEVMLISPQPHANTEDLAQRFDVPMTFLTDRDGRMAEQLGINAKNGTPAGLQALGYDSDTVMPTVLMTDAAGLIIYADLTENYRIRPEPDEFLQVFAQAGI
ncbi:MAG: redoxin domain-containing protein [Paraperlucidibaca sp.]